MGWLKKFAGLPFATKLLLVESLMRLTVVSAAVHLMPRSVGRRHWTGALGPKTRLGPKRRAHDRANLAWAVLAASRFVPGATCLVQAIVGQRLFLRAGYAAEVKIGVTRDEDGAVAAHAWLVSEGEVFIGRDAREYSEMPVPSTANLSHHG